ncbi:hypothetical protein FGO68_gene12355 [Halteria grandinella]|uniref:Uncharacterized protein n=1 Tax=Halteria grandinella TaxID=5974 RepID=A0A8J8P7L3_HALGN|nr:hypothetical protein FGO68_gene12355 [Halteria grandinella]
MYLANPFLSPIMFHQPQIMVPIPQNFQPQQQILNQQPFPVLQKKGKQPKPFPVIKPRPFTSTSEQKALAIGIRCLLCNTWTLDNKYGWRSLFKHREEQHKAQTKDQKKKLKESIYPEAIQKEIYSTPQLAKAPKKGYERRLPAPGPELVRLAQQQLETSHIVSPYEKLKPVFAQADLCKIENKVESESKDVATYKEKEKGEEGISETQKSVTLEELQGTNEIDQVLDSESKKDQVSNQSQAQKEEATLEHQDQKDLASEQEPLLEQDPQEPSGAIASDQEEQEPQEIGLFDSTNATHVDIKPSEIQFKPAAKAADPNRYLEYNGYSYRFVAKREYYNVYFCKDHLKTKCLAKLFLSHDLKQFLKPQGDTWSVHKCRGDNVEYRGYSNTRTKQYQEKLLEQNIEEAIQKYKETQKEANQSAAQTTLQQQQHMPIMIMPQHQQTIILQPPPLQHFQKPFNQFASHYLKERRTKGPLPTFTTPNIDLSEEPQKSSNCEEYCLNLEPAFKRFKAQHIEPLQKILVEHVKMMSQMNDIIQSQSIQIEALSKKQGKEQDEINLEDAIMEKE